MIIGSLLEIMEWKRQWDDIDKKMKKYDYKNFISEKTILKREGEIEKFPDKWKLRQFVASRFEIQNIQKTKKLLDWNKV